MKRSIKFSEKFHWSNDYFIPILFACLGFLLRIAVSFRGHNFDIESYEIVANIVSKGGNVYLETARYNYGPIWFYVLYVLNLLSGFFSNHVVVFRHLVAGFISLIDIGIYFFLLKKVNRTVAYLFILNPISIIISGYHSQFDNFSIFFAMIAVHYFGDNFEEKINKQKLIGLIFLGLSLMIKHLFFAFPLWLAFKQRGIKQKILVVFIPIFIFILGFAPYWKEGSEGIINNVFLYNSFNNQFFYRLFVPEIVSRFLSAFQLWILLLIFAGIVFRAKDSFTSLLLYSSILVAASPAIANQYLAIVIPFVSVFPNIFNIAYSVLGSLFLLIDDEALHLAGIQEKLPMSQNQCIGILIAVLTFGIIWTNWRDNILSFIRKTGKIIPEILT
jgi:hypothetical protein